MHFRMLAACSTLACAVLLPNVAGQLSRHTEYNMSTPCPSQWNHSLHIWSQYAPGAEMPPESHPAPQLQLAIVVHAD